MKTLKYIFTVLLLCSLSNHQLQAQSTSKIDFVQLPKTAQEELNGKYGKYKVNSINKKEDKQKKTTYMVEVQKKNTLFELVYNESGQLVDKTKSKSFSFDGTEPKRKPTTNSNDGHNHTH